MDFYVSHYPSQVVEGVPSPTSVYVRGASPSNVVTGSVIFVVEGVLSEPITLVDGSAEAPLTFPTPGARPFEVIYSGDAAYAPTTYSPGIQVARTSHAVLTITPEGGVPGDPAIVGKSVSFDVAVTGAGDTPTGLVRFYVDDLEVKAAPLVNGSQNFSTQFASPGTHKISAVYLGTSVYAQFPMTPQTLLVVEPSTVTLTGSATTVPIDGFIGLTAQVSPEATGTVTFYSGETSLGEAAINADGVATLRAQLRHSGLASITASYSGDPRFSSADSSVLEVLVTAAVPVIPGGSGTTPTPTPGLAVAGTRTTVALANTGISASNSSLILIGAGLVAVGLSLLVLRRKARRLPQS